MEGVAMGAGFEDLEVYREARNLRRRMFELSQLLPREERYGLFGQIRRAALSVTNCIAEGHGSRSFRHNMSYLYRARGSVCELQDDLNACEDEGYFKKDHLDDLRADTETVNKLINGYIRHLRGRLAETERAK
jgi:four helix bundle protein